MLDGLLQRKLVAWFRFSHRAIPKIFHFTRVILCLREKEMEEEHLFRVIDLGNDYSIRSFKKMSP